MRQQLEKLKGKTIDSIEQASTDHVIIRFKDGFRLHLTTHIIPAGSGWEASARMEAILG